MKTVKADATAPGTDFLTVVLWLCAAGALWLLLSPAAFRRRVLTARAYEETVAVERERLRAAGLERWRDGLASDPSVIEREARKLGYGRPDERCYPLSPERDLANAETAWVRNAQKAERVRNASATERERAAGGRKTIGAALMAIIGGAIAFLFFRDLRIDDPDERAATNAASEDSH